MSISISKSLLLGLGLLSCSLSFAAVKEYHLVIDQGAVNKTGKSVQRITVNGQFPAPQLSFEEGDDAVIHVENKLKNQPSSVHWHGLLLPGLMDGVPGLNGFQSIAPQAQFTYKFKVRQSGTYWYHAHSKGQEQDGLYGALVIYPKGHTPIAQHEKTDRDYVVMLSDFHESSSENILKNLKKSADYYQNQRETVKDVQQQMKTTGIKATWQARSMWNNMRMLRTDLSDVTGYTFLVNGKTPNENWFGAFAPNEKVRLRFINASAMSFFDVRIPHLKMTVVSADGQAVKPVTVDEFRIGAAETYDVIVEPTDMHYQIQAESIDRSGFALASLRQDNQQHAAHNMSVIQPKARPRAVLNMQDMGHGAQASEHDTAHMNSVEDHATHSSVQQTPTDAHDHATMQKADHAILPIKPSVVEGWANASTPVGHKALQYQDLKSLKPQMDTRSPSAEIVIHLGGNMERYIWTMNGKKFSEAEPIQVKYGERVRLTFKNDSMMAHPMHLHGMFVQLENGQSLENLPNKHTLIVPPGKTVSALLTADELGEWAIHCHLLYHMSAGMMNKLVVGNVSNVDAAQMQKQGAQHEHH